MIEIQKWIFTIIPELARVIRGSQLLVLLARIQTLSLDRESFRDRRVILARVAGETFHSFT